MQPQVGGGNNADEDFRLSFGGMVAEADIAGDIFIRAGGGEAVGTGEVEYPDGGILWSGEKSDLPFDRNTSIVADFLAAPCELIKQGCFAAIRVSGKGDVTGRGGGHKTLLGVLQVNAGSFAAAESKA
ncbi:hypothetical protein AA106556_0294 [Neokomagataea tanensis NBRC 106556]|uniref:Uncharacterized protein n=1 Tax=Neokomagataea tanensis NBRC 106556 TaxID=1223519 RepID=A0ABQ0QGI6_9PROT|nr:hypothetical protein AA106556_0294 [Neokomagataea tanensis NBRC 106556]